jgi:uncharacterized membrane protein
MSLKVNNVSRTLVSLLLLSILIPTALGATLHGSIYNTNLQLEEDVLIEITTTPHQQQLSKEGQYSFELDPGEYTLSARKGLISVTENIRIEREGSFVFDVFLLDDLTQEEELWQDLDENPIVDEEDTTTDWWRYVLTGAIILYGVNRILKNRKRFGSVSAFRKSQKKEQKKSIEQHKADLENEPGYIDQALQIIQQHDGRITQKALRREMMYLSEAKVSLILTELEHKGKIKKIKKGRGNVILLE